VSHLRRGSNVAPLPGFFCQAFFHLQNYPRAFRGIPKGARATLGGAATSPRYPAFFAKLFFTRKKSGGLEKSMNL